ncbi:hypothetical protein V3851_26005 [Paenibacillus sp. M1]|uniref:Copper amine oxidase-like N-terminal domain-containing protein n=1 Tax=Paenibacillus haidiansis TaxID=1574488 RepID=A0ABU7VZP4_9BACL
MKKFAYVFGGIIIGMAISLPFGQTFADQIASLVGKTITAEYTVKVNGEALEDKAVVTDNKTYAPVRAYAEKMGATITVDTKQKVVDVLTQEVPEAMSETPITQEAAETTKIEDEITLTDENLTINPYLEMDAEKLETKRWILEDKIIAPSKTALEEAQKKLASPDAHANIEELEKKVDYEKERIAKYEGELKLVQEAIQALEN